MATAPGISAGFLNAPLMGITATGKAIMAPTIKNIFKVLTRHSASLRSVSLTGDDERIFPYTFGEF